MLCRPVAGWGAGSGIEDRADIGGLEPPERHRPGQGGEHLFAAVGGDEPEDVIEFTAQAGVADGCGTDQELLSNLTEIAKLLLYRGFGSWCTTGRCAWPPVVAVVEDDLTRCGQQMFGDHLTGGGFGDQKPLTVLDEGHGGADEPVGH
ncbi:hypothetical protein QBL07_013885 [Gordonia rubripertincta]|uniref:hypothetical protein n=1 Tax=Gordonia rubripertincta TaxID=36822 RepID=UPI0039B4FBD9